MALCSVAPCNAPCAPPAAMLDAACRPPLTPDDTEEATRAAIATVATDHVTNP